jgi:nodulation protein E
MNRVVITGLGCITPSGDSPDALWQALERGTSSISSLGPEHTNLRFRNAGQIGALDLSGFNHAQSASTERSAQIGILAARQAIAQAAWAGHYPPEKIAILLGCSTNGRQAEEPEIARVYTHDARVHPLTVPRSMASNGVSQVAIDQGITGPALTISTACASGAHAIGLAFHMVRSGMVSAAVAGAHESPLTRAFLRAWDSMRVVSPTQCRPFSADRDGMTLAEGAAMLTLETLTSARARGATIYAEILGLGMSTDAHHITQPKVEGPEQAIRACLRDAAETLHSTGQPGTAQSLMEEVAYVNAHGTGTQANDSTEAAALHAVFGPRAAHIPVSSTKGFYGHSLGASSAIETLITALALYHRRLPLTCGTTAVDPALDLDIILGESRALPASGPVIALTNALAFGGLNAVLCLRSAPVGE